MVGISISAKKEWVATLKKFGKSLEDCEKFPFGEYFSTRIKNEKILLYRCGNRKVNASASTQYMIDKFNLKKVIVAGTCAGIDRKYKPLDVFIPNLAVQYDCTVKEIEPLIKEAFNVGIDLSGLDFEFNTGTIGSADKAVVMWKDYLELKRNKITIADTEAAAIAYVCMCNKINCIIVKGISDFPIKVENKNKLEAYDAQTQTFIKNVPIIMNKIFDEYLPKVL